jgi:hypothetical protein
MKFFFEKRKGCDVGLIRILENFSLRGKWERDHPAM